MFVGKTFVDKLVINMNTSGLVSVTFIILVHGHILDEVKAHPACKLCCSRIDFHTADILVNIGFVLPFSFGTEL